ncbi:MAG: CocE/NonD family hydrolase [Verrucomicrobiales bacterium]
MQTYTKFLFLVAALAAPALSANAQQGRTRAAALASAYPALPASVARRQVTIWSDGTKMAGDLYSPVGLEPEAKLPAIVFISGTGGTKKGSPARMAPLFVEKGYLFLTFDYRGWGESESKLQSLYFFRST